MLSKLLKYDLKYMLKNMIVFFVLAIFFAISTRVFISLKQTVFINVMAKISAGCMFSMIGSIIFNVVIRSYVRFRDSIYKDESYLTHTLPVTKTQIYESKFIQSLIFLVIGFVVSVASLVIAYYSKDTIIMIENFFEMASSGLDINVYFVLLLTLLVFFLELFNIIQCGFLGIICGNKNSNNKILFSFVFGFISYMITQLLAVVSILISGFFNKNVISIFNSASVDSSVLSFLLIFAVVVYLLINIIVNIVCVVQINKGVNVD